MMKRRRQRGEIDGVTRCVCQHTVQTVCGGSVSVWDVCVCVCAQRRARCVSLRPGLRFEAR